MPGTPGAVELKIEAAKPVCCSRSDCMSHPRRCPLIQDLLRLRGFRQEYRERRQIRVPFDQRRHRANARERFAVQIPDWTRHRLAVSIDKAQPIAVEACEMDF